MPRPINGEAEWKCLIRNVQKLVPGELAPCAKTFEANPINSTLNIARFNFRILMT